MSIAQESENDSHYFAVVYRTEEAVGSGPFSDESLKAFLSYKVVYVGKAFTVMLLYCDDITSDAQWEIINKAERNMDIVNFVRVYPDGYGE